jgi:hypothetical protein
MCGSLPTLRVFIKHVAPSLIGEKTSKNGSGGNQPSSTGSFGLRTFGAGGGSNRRKFDTLAELEDDDHWQHPEFSGSETNKNEVTVHAGGEAKNGSWVNAHLVKEDDGASEEAILRTRTTTVTVS